MKRILLILIPLLFLMTGCEEDTNTYEGIVQDKYFQAGTTSTGVGLSMNGQMVVTTTSTTDQYIIFVNGKDYLVKKEIWFELEKGQKISYQQPYFDIVNIQVIE